MILHIVLLKPRPDLTDDDRRRFVRAFERAIRESPDVRGVRVARRVRHGAAYETVAPDAADYAAIIEFDDLAGLQAYLRHPAHHELGERFSQAIEAAMVYDVEVGSIEEMAG